MKRHGAPYVVFGARKGKANKAVIGGVSRKLGGGTRAVIIYQLNHYKELGSTDITDDDIEGEYFTMYFCHRENLEVFIRALQDILDNWREDDENKAGSNREF